MDNNIIDKRTMWEALYDKLKLETDQNKELVKSIVAGMQTKNAKLAEQNNSLLEALKDCYRVFEAEYEDLSNVGKAARLKAMEAIQKAEQ